MTDETRRSSGGSDAVVNLRRLDCPPGIQATGEQAVVLDDQLAELPPPTLTALHALS